MKQLLRSKLKIAKELKPEFLVFAILLLIRLPDLGNDTFNTDVWKWKARTYNFLNSLASGDLRGTSQSYHPGVPLMALGAAGVKTHSFYYKVLLSSTVSDSTKTIFEIHRLQKFYVVFLISFLLTLSFYLLRKLIGIRVATVSMFFINTEPFFLAHTREFHLEGLLAVFGFVSVFLMIASIKKGEAGRYLIILSAIFSALAVLTKSSGLFFPAFNSLILLLASQATRKMSKDTFKKAIRALANYLLLFVASVFFLWPALWVAPVETVSNFIRGITDVGVEGDHLQLFFGELVSDPGPIFYFLNLILRVSPLGVVGLMVAVWFKISGKLKNGVASTSLLFILLFLVYLTIPSKKLDRYIVPVFPFIGVVVAFVMEKIWNDVKRVQLVLFTAILLSIIRLITVYSVHPNYLFYYSSLVGGFSRAMNMVEPKWVAGGPIIGEYFNALNDPEAIVAFPEKYFTQLWPFLENHSVIMDVRKDAERSKYFVYPAWEDTAKDENRVSLTRYGSISVEGVDAYHVYINESPK